MARIIVTALSALTFIALGIVALQYRVQKTDTGNFTATDQEAFNLATNVSGDAMTVASNALPRLLMIVIIVFVIILLLIIRQ